LPIWLGKLFGYAGAALCILVAIFILITNP